MCGRFKHGCPCPTGGPDEPRLSTKYGYPDYYLVSTLCPYCGVRLDGAAPNDLIAHAPMPGDVSCCIKCGGVMIFTDTLALRVMTDALWAEIDKDLQQELTELFKQIRESK